VGRIEWVADDAALGTLGAGLDDVHGNPGRAGGEDRCWRSGFVHLREQLDLEVGSLRGVLLDEVCLGERLAHVRRESQPIAGSTGRDEPGLGELGPGVVDVLAEVRLRVGRRIGGDDVEST